MIQPHEGQKDWDQYLPYVGFAYRASVQASTGESPNMMMLGREVNLPVDLVLGAVPHEKELDTEYADDLRERIRTIHERARYALEMSARRQKKNYDRLVHGPTYKQGQFVWLYDTKRKIGLSKKLSLPWEGPYLVVQVLSDVTVRIQRSARGKPKVVHIDRLKLYEGPELVSWRYKAPRDVVEEELVGPVMATDDQQATVGSQPLADKVGESRQSGTVVTTEQGEERGLDEQGEGGNDEAQEPERSQETESHEGAEERDDNPVQQETEESELPFGRRNPRRPRVKPARYR